MSSIKTKMINIKEDERFPFRATHVESDDQYLKIWAQIDFNVVNSLETFLSQSQIQSLLESKSLVAQYVAPNHIQNYKYCAKRKGYFARAKVIQVGTDGQILVHFIDYGDKAYVDLIYLIDSSPELDVLITIPAAATDFIVYGLCPIGGAWDTNLIIAIYEILINSKNVLWGQYKNINNKKAVKFYLLNEDFSTLLVNRNMALLNPVLFESKTVQPQLMHQDVLSQDNSRNVKPIQKVVKSNSFKAIQLEIGTLHDVRISYVEEGPCKFSVQKLGSIPYLNNMMEKINNQNHLPLQESPIAGTVCLGRQSRSNKLCRVVLNSPGDTSCKGYYADYGHHEMLSFSDMYQIPDEFVVPNVFSIRFTLSGIINWNISEDMKDYFQGLVLDKNLKLKVCKGPNSPLIQYCELFLEGKSVKDILRLNFPESCTLVYMDYKRLKEGSKENVFISFVKSTTKFFVQLEKDSKLLNEVMDEIEVISKVANVLSPTELHCNMPCLALYDVDSKWYRASIINSVSNGKVKVFYVDYGNEEIVSINNLKAIPPELVEKLPKQAIPCSLKGYQSEHVDQELIKNFEDLVLEERLMLIVLKNLPETIIVDLIDPEDYSPLNSGIASKLKAFETVKIQKIIPSGGLEINSVTSFEPLQLNKQVCEGKTQVVSVQKQRSKNKNIKTRTGNYKSEGYQTSKTNTFQNYEIEKSKFRKDNENEQRHDNRFWKGNSNYSSSHQSNRYDKEGQKPKQSGSKDYLNNDRFSRGSSSVNLETNDFRAEKFGKENHGNRTSLNSRLERNFHSDKCGSDKDSDASSRSSGSRNNQEKRNYNDQHRQDNATNNRNHLGRWENDQDRNKHKSDDMSKDSTMTKSPNTFNKSKSSELNISSNETLYIKDASRYITSTPISKIPPPNITVGAVKMCTIVYYYNQSSFFVQLHPDSEELNGIMGKISNLYKNGGKVLQLNEIKPDLQCIAQYSEDNEWYRAIIKSVTDSNATVHFIDYGNVETVTFNKIKEIEPEFLELPAQAIHCKLFCPQKISWTAEESSKLLNETDNKQLEAEFVAEENGIYEILLKESNPFQQTSRQFINELFVSGVDLIREKQLLRNNTRAGTKELTVAATTNYASPDDQWIDIKIILEKPYELQFISWFTTPQNFYCQLNDHLKEFHDMMKEIQIVYVNHHPVSEPLKIGSPVIALFESDNVLYRAEILEINKSRSYLVQYIDYGNRAYVHEQNIYSIEKKYMTLPRQAVHCSLKNISPLSGNVWPCKNDPNFLEMQKLFDTEKLECVFHEVKNGQYFISLNINGNDITKMLVKKEIAIFTPEVTNNILNLNSEDITKIENIPRIDLNLLEGQTLLVKVSSVEGVGKFYVQFYTAETCQSTVDTFMDTKDSNVMPRLLSHEVCIGAGCLVYYKGKWSRGVVINFTKKLYGVKFIDTGEYKVVSLKSMLRLPGNLATMQNQAIECSLFDAPVSSETDDEFRTATSTKDVKIFVEKVDSNRLLVRMFDLVGNKIKVTEEQNTETIHPVCSMPILNSTHDVIVSHVNNSNSVWLQKKIDSKIKNSLLSALFEYYKIFEENVEPEENKLYAGLTVEGKWHRVMLMKVKDTDAIVQLIDYGPVVEIPIKNLRNLDTRFHLPHQLAVEVSLIICLEGDSDVQKNILEPLINNKEFTAKFYNVNRKWIAELTDNDQKLSDKFSELAFVKEAAEMLPGYVALPEMREGEKYKVFVSHIDAPNEFWIHRYEDVDAINNLQAKLQLDSSQLSNCNTVLEEKSLCLAAYSVDDSWYRAEVIFADSEIITVRFIDFGNTDVIMASTNKVKNLPAKWKSIKKFAIPCKLDLEPRNERDIDWNEEACERFSKLVKINTPLQAFIIADKAPMRIDLFLGDQSICKTLVDEELARYSNNFEKLDEDIVEELELDPKSAFVSNSESVDEFWVHEEKNVNDLEMMQDRLLMYSMFPEITKIENGLFCIAQFPEDKEYYRSIVLSDKEDGALVRYVDYGNTAITNDIREIPEDLTNIPPLARKCRLIKPDGIEQWPTGINEEFSTLAANGMTVFILDIVEEGNTSLVKLSYNHKDVATELVQQCLKKTLQPVDESISVEEAKTAIDQERLSPIGE